MHAAGVDDRLSPQVVCQSEKINAERFGILHFLYYIRIDKNNEGNENLQSQ